MAPPDTGAVYAPGYCSRKGGWFEARDRHGRGSGRRPHPRTGTMCRAWILPWTVDPAGRCEALRPMPSGESRTRSGMRVEEGRENRDPKGPGLPSSRRGDVRSRVGSWWHDPGPPMDPSRSPGHRHGARPWVQLAERHPRLDEAATEPTTPRQPPACSPPALSPARPGVVLTVALAGPARRRCSHGARDQRIHTHRTRRSGLRRFRRPWVGATRPTAGHVIACPWLASSFSPEAP